MPKPSTRRPGRPLHPGDARRLLAASRTPQDAALVVLLWRAGLRAAEACGLEQADVAELEGGALRLHVRHGKGDRARFVGLDAASAAYLAPLRTEACGPLLRTAAGRALHVSQTRRTLRALARRAGIAGRVHPHALRHTYARELHDEGFSVRAIQVALGHSTLATTQTYLESIGCADVVDETTRRAF